MFHLPLIWNCKSSAVSRVRNFSNTHQVLSLLLLYTEHIHDIYWLIHPLNFWLGRRTFGLVACFFILSTYIRCVTSIHSTVIALSYRKEQKTFTSFALNVVVVRYNKFSKEMIYVWYLATRREKGKRNRFCNSS